MRWLAVAFVFLLASASLAVPHGGVRHGSELIGGAGAGWASGDDIDPANILFAEDTGDGVNNITAFAGDILTLSATGATGDIIIDSDAGKLTFNGGGGAGDEVLFTSGAAEIRFDTGAANIVFDVGSVSNGLQFRIVSASDIMLITQGPGGIVDFLAQAATAPTTAFVFDRANVPNAGVAHTLFQNDNSEVGRVNHLGNIVSVPETLTIDDTGADTTPGTATITPHARSFQITCNDDDGCDVTLAEANALNGTQAEIVNVSANVVRIDSVTNTLEVNGEWHGLQYDSLDLSYVVDRWVEIGRSTDELRLIYDTDTTSLSGTQCILLNGVGTAPCDESGAVGTRQYFDEEVVITHLEAQINGNTDSTDGCDIIVQVGDDVSGTNLRHLTMKNPTLIRIGDTFELDNKGDVASAEMTGAGTILPATASSQANIIPAGGYVQVAVDNTGGDLCSNYGNGAFFTLYGHRRH
jgi:hypothetical protein